MSCILDSTYSNYSFFGKDPMKRIQKLIRMLDVYFIVLITSWGPLPTCAGMEKLVEKLDTLSIGKHLDPFNYFPIEITLLVLAKLTAKDIASCTKVCKAWHSLASDPLLWEAYDDQVVYAKFISWLLSNNHPRFAMQTDCQIPLSDIALDQQLSEKGKFISYIRSFCQYTDPKKALARDLTTALKKAARDKHGKLVGLLITLGANHEALQDPEDPINDSEGFIANIITPIEQIFRSIQISAFAEKNVIAIELGEAETACTKLKSLWIVPFLINPEFNFLHTSAFVGSFDMCLFFIKNGANIHSVTIDGETVLHLAAASGYLGCNNTLMAHFIQAGVQPDHQDTRGYTALHYAAEKGYLAAVMLLVNKGSSLSLKTTAGKTARDLACESSSIDCGEVVSYLDGLKPSRRGWCMVT